MLFIDFKFFGDQYIPRKRVELMRSALTIHKLFIVITFLFFTSSLPETTSAQTPPATSSSPSQQELQKFILETITRLDSLSTGKDKPEFGELRRIRTELTRRFPQAQSEVEQSQLAIHGLRDEVAIATDNLRYFHSEIRRIDNSKKRHAGDERRLVELQKRIEKFESDDVDPKVLDEQDSEYSGLKEEATYLTDQIKRYKAELDFLNDDIESFQQDINEAETTLIEAQEKTKNLHTRILSQNLDLIELRDIQSQVDDLIHTLLIPETAQNEFKSNIAMVFAGLVFAVILGFFVIAFKDAHVRQSIFSSQSGIQFLTLFSLVIAIILFGITGILEDKELAALLGGLSGYILGRVGSNDSVREQTPPAAQPATPPI